MSKYLCLVLPYPPTANTLFAGLGRRYKSTGYKAWIKEAGIALNRQHKEHFGLPVKETISLGIPRRKDGEASKVKRDLGNCEKAISDLLVTHNILMDDSLIHELHMKWSDDVVGAMVEIEERL